MSSHSSRPKDFCFGKNESLHMWKEWSAWSRYWDVLLPLGWQSFENENGIYGHKHETSVWKLSSRHLWSFEGRGHLCLNKNDEIQKKGSILIYV